MTITRDDLESRDADRIRLRGRWSPGVAIVAGASAPRAWDVQDGHGLVGASVRFVGDKLAKFTVEIRLFEPEHFEAWGDFAKLLAKPTSRADAPKRAMRIEHPALAEIGISDVVVEDRTQLVQVEPGVWSSTISFIQYKKPRPVLSRPAGSIPSTGTNPTAKDAADEEILRLKAQADELSKRDAAL